MGFNLGHTTDIDLPDDFDDVLRVFYERAIHPREIDELAGNLAAALQDHDVTTAQTRKVLVEHNVADFNPESARQLAVEIVQLRREEGPNISRHGR